MKNRIKAILFVFALLLLIACSPPADQQEEPKEPAKEEVPKESPLGIKIIEAADFEVGKLAYDGEIVEKRAWLDAKGENIVLFTQKEEELFVYHYAIKADSALLLRRIYDFEKDCEFDQTLEFVEASIGVTDLDEDNLGEITFAYRKACISDVSPLELKLLMLEDGEKYIIRGNTLITFGEESIGGDKEVDASFEAAPKVFLEHALEVWDAVVPMSY
ncbi:MAG: hypothetical protein AAFQ68_04110 [Bacteroidota bacterium]